MSLQWGLKAQHTTFLIKSMVKSTFLHFTPVDDYCSSICRYCDNLPPQLEHHFRVHLEKGFGYHFYMEKTSLNTKWEDIICPICLEFPHNGVLLQCSSFGNGCRPYVCDTDHLHSNCLDRFKNANRLSSCSMSPFSSDSTSPNIVDPGFPESSERPTCPLCRGEVTGWVTIDKARKHLNEKQRCCDEYQCRFTGTYLELRKHAQLEHPHAYPSKIDPAQQLDWEIFQQSSEMIDVLSAIHAEIPRGVVLGDYVIEYVDNDTVDNDFEDTRGGVENNWWTSCILYQVFDKFRNSRNRRRSTINNSRRVRRSLSYGTSNSDEGSVPPLEFAEYRIDDDFARSRDGSGNRARHRSHWRQRPRFYDN